MKNIFTALMAKVLGTGYVLISIFDILQPIYSIGYIFVWVFAGLTIYFYMLSRHYRTYEELLEHRKALAHIQPIQDFYQKNWDWQVILTFFALFLIALAGAFLTNENSEEGGFYAAHFEQVKKLQDSIQGLEEGQREIKEELEGISKTTKTILENTRTYTLSEMVADIKQNENPTGRLSELFVQGKVKYEYTVDDVLYLSELFSKRPSHENSMMFLMPLFESCKENSFTEEQFIRVFRNLTLDNVIDMRVVIGGSLSAIEYCMKSNATDKLARYFLLDHKDNILPTYFQSSEQLSKVLNYCEQPIEEDLFKKNAVPDVRENNSVHRTILEVKKNGSSCISDSTAKIINAQYNRTKFLAKGYYLDKFHIYTAECFPKITAEEIETSRSLAITIRESKIRKAKENGCVL